MPKFVLLHLGSKAACHTIPKNGAAGCPELPEHFFKAAVTVPLLSRFGFFRFPCPKFSVLSTAPRASWCLTVNCCLMEIIPLFFTFHTNFGLRLVASNISWNYNLHGIFSCFMLQTLQVFDQNANRSLPSSREKNLQHFSKILLAAEFSLKDKCHTSIFILGRGKWGEYV